MSDSVQPHRRQPARLPRPWDSPGKNTGVGCHFPLQCMEVKSESEVTQSCPTLVTPWTAAHQAPPSMGFSRQKYWSGVPLPSPIKPLYTNKKRIKNIISRPSHPLTAQLCSIFLLAIRQNPKSSACPSRPSTFSPPTSIPTSPFSMYQPLQVSFSGHHSSSHWLCTDLLTPFPLW